MSPSSKEGRVRSGVRLVRLDQTHAPNMVRWMRDRTVRLNVGLHTTPTLSTTRRWVMRAMRDTTMRPFAILLGREHVGNVVLDRIDRHLGTARLSIYVGARAARGMGVGRTAVTLALRRAFGRLDLRKVWLTVHDHNVPAIETYLSVGFLVEGVLRDEFRLGRRRMDVLYMGVLAQEWRG